MVGAFQTSVSNLWGASLAIALVKVYYARAFDRLRTRQPASIEFDVHIDDIVQAMEGGTEEVVAGLAEAHEELTRTITEILKGRVAESKTTAIGSSREVAVGLCRRLGIDDKVKRGNGGLGGRARGGRKTPEGEVQKKRKDEDGCGEESAVGSSCEIPRG